MADFDTRKTGGFEGCGMIGSQGLKKMQEDLCIAAYKQKYGKDPDKEWVAITQGMIARSIGTIETINAIKAIIKTV